MRNDQEIRPRNGERAATGAGYIRQRAYDTLKANILNGHLRRGERLSETRLMHEFGIGRTPVLEGLDAIAAELAANVASDADLERLRGVMSEIEALDSVHTR